MSYLNNTRLVFSGAFQADISTVNNDVRHYDNATFEPRFQDLRLENGALNGWFNPTGSGAFRLIDCRITQVCYSDGTTTKSAQQDSAVGLMIGGANERVAAKLVDLDPQWQNASEIWGLVVRLTAGTEPARVQGQFLHSAFRDLCFRRVAELKGDGAASSTFQSVLEKVVWTPAADHSRALKELKAVAALGNLSIRLMTFAYVGRVGDPRFSLGTVCGVIGPMLAHEPKTFVLGRRFAPATRSRQSWNGISTFTGVIDETSSTLLLDLGNALRLRDAHGSVCDIGNLTVGILLDPSLAEQAPVCAANFETLGEIDYRTPNWLFETSGICSLPLSPQQLQSVLRAPLALAVDEPAGEKRIAIRENKSGLFSCAEEFVQRIDAPGSGKLTIYAAQFGRPLAGARVVLNALPTQSGWGGANPEGPNPPKAEIPATCTPAEALSFPASVTTDADGRAAIEIVVKSPGNPRGYLEGQIYVIRYGIDGEPPNAHAENDAIVVHVRDAFDVPEKPAWMPHIASIFTQYGNLYPIMSQRLVDLSDPESVMRSLKILRLAFSLDITDPNYMPVTRDMSQNKRIAIQRWLERLATEGDPTFVGGPRVHTTIATGTQSAIGGTAPDTSEPLGGKTSFTLSMMLGRDGQD